MSQPISFGPLQEFDLSDRFWPQPNCLLHFLGIQFFAKSVPDCQHFDSCSAGKLGVTEIGRKRYRDVTHPPFCLHTLALLCEELSYFDWEQKRILLRTASKAGWRKLIPARN